MKSLNEGIGSDELHSSHLKIFDRSNLNYIKMLLNACLSYGFVPAVMFNCHIKLILKNEFGDTLALDNYHEIMYSTNLYKLMEFCILQIMERKVSLRTSQFAYRANTSISLATLLLKWVLQNSVWNDNNFLRVSLKCVRLLNALTMSYF